MFNENLSHTYQNFTWMHFIPVLVIVLIISLMIIYKSSLRRFTFIPIVLASLTIFQEITLNLFRISNDTWDISSSLPLHLCGFGVLLSSYLLISKQRKLFNYTFFIMMLGAIMAILTPAIDDNFGFPHFRYFQFFISHGLITINFMYMLIVLDYQKDITYRHILFNVITLVVIAILVTPINLITGGNYLFLMGSPGEDTAFELFGKWPWYLINIALFGIPIFFHIGYIPFYIRDLKAKKRLTSQS
jgi:hypothetical integral membrane protein (TIGR02206 family)